MFSLKNSYRLKLVDIELNCAESLICRPAGSSSGNMRVIISYSFSSQDRWQQRTFDDCFLQTYLSSAGEYNREMKNSIHHHPGANQKYLMIRRCISKFNPSVPPLIISSRSGSNIK